jgi:NADH-quinone oxidoreductase subunit K
MSHLMCSVVFVVLFLLGMMGIVFNRKNIIVMLMCIELMLLGVVMHFLSASVFLDDLVGCLMGLFILTVAAAESAIGLALLVAYHKRKGDISIEHITLLRG